MNVTELDFERIKEQLRDFLKEYPEFKDFNFEGSSISYLLNILAANTVYNSFYLHMVANEMFLDTAQSRNNIVSNAKMNGYVPYSKTSSMARVKVRLSPAPVPTEIFVPEKTKFTSRIDAKVFQFHTRESYTILPENGIFETEMELYEGTPIVHRYTIDLNRYLPESHFLIPNPNVDTSLLTVKVQRSASENILETMFPNKDITELTSESNVYFLNEVEDGKFSISFGDGVLGRKLESGNIVIIDYVISIRSESNKCNSFSLVTSIGGITNAIIRTIAPASGGKEAETDESIRYTAPKYYQAQNRMVNWNDYETLIKTEFPSIESVRVWGGEKHKPYPEYGKVFVAIKPLDGYVITETMKTHIINRIIKPRNTVSIEAVIQEPHYIFLKLENTVNYDSRITSDSENVIRQIFKEKVLSYGSESLSQFDKYFQFSKYTNTVSQSHPAISNIVTKTKLLKRLVISTITENEYDIDFANSLDSTIDSRGKTCLSSDSFMYNGFRAYLKDDGKGSIIVYRIVEGRHIIITEKIGTIDYATGRVVLKKFYTPEVFSGNNFLEITVKPLDSNIFSERNQIIVIDEKYLDITMKDVSIR